MQVIIYKNDTGGVNVIFPIAGCGLTTEEIASKDVPHGRPFKIVDIEDLPLDGTLNEHGIPNIDKTLFNQWTVDESDLNDGIGLGALRWFIKELEKDLAFIFSREYTGSPEKGGNQNPEQVTEEEFEAAYQAYIIQHKAEFDDNKASTIANLNSRIAAFQAEIAKEQ
jgi:hypothetical protein